MRRSRGGVLLEVIVALAIFVGAGMLILGSLSRASEGLARTRELEQAADLARSTMAKIESGLARPETLIGPVREEENERGSFSGLAAARVSPWEVEIETEPFAFDGLTHVTVRAFKRTGDGGERSAFTLHQLVRLFDQAKDGAGEEDPLAERARRRDGPRPGERTPGGRAPAGGER